MHRRHRYLSALFVAAPFAFTALATRGTHAAAAAWQKNVKNVEVIIGNYYACEDGDLCIGTLPPPPFGSAKAKTAWNRWHDLFWYDAYFTKDHEGVDPSLTLGNARDIFFSEVNAEHIGPASEALSIYDKLSSSEVNKFLGGLGVPKTVEQWIRKGQYGVTHSDYETSGMRAACNACIAQYPEAKGDCYPFEPEKEICKAIFACATCNFMLADATFRGDPTEGPSFGTDMSYFGAQAEVEPPNVTKAAIPEWLGFPGGGCNMVTTKTGACGKRAYVSGLLSHDQTHDYKPEIHPLQSILIEEETSDDAFHKETKYNIATFIDGSDRGGAGGFYRGQSETMDAAGIGTGDYHAPSDTEYPATATINLADLLGDKPNSDKGWVAFCNVEELPAYGHNVVSFKKVETNLLGCPTLEVAMNKSSDEGASWGGTVRMGWSKVGLSMVAKLDKTSGTIGAFYPGYLTKPGSPPAKKYRWWKFEVTATRSVSDELPSVKSTWSGLGPLEPPEPTFKPAKGKQSAKFTRWVRTSWSLQKEGLNPYKESVSVRLQNGNQTIAKSSADLGVPKPTVSIQLARSPKNLTALAGPALCPVLGPQCKALPKFTRSLGGAVAKHFAYGNEGVKKTWSVNGKDVATAPSDVALCNEQSAIVSVTATDKDDVERATDVLLLTAPHLEGTAKVEYSGASTSKPNLIDIVANASGVTIGEEVKTVYKTVKVVPAAMAVGEDGKATPSVADIVNVEWANKDVLYRTKGDWTPVPAKFRKLEGVGTLVIDSAGLAGDGEEVHFTAKGTVKDVYCRSAEVFATWSNTKAEANWTSHTTAPQPAFFDIGIWMKNQGLVNAALAGAAQPGLIFEGGTRDPVARQINSIYERAGGKLTTKQSNRLLKEMFAVKINAKNPQSAAAAVPAGMTKKRKVLAHEVAAKAAFHAEVARLKK